MAEEFVLERQHCVQSAIEALVVDLLGRHAQQVIERGFSVPEIGDLQLGGRSAETRQRQDARDRRPGNSLAPRLHRVVEKAIQPQALPEGQAEMNFAEPPQPLDAQTLQVDRGPFRRVRLHRLEEIVLMEFPVENLADVFPADARFRVHPREFSQRRYDALTRPTRRPHRLDQRPIFVSRSVLLATVSSEKHGHFSPEPNRFWPKPNRVTRGWSALHGVSESAARVFRQTGRSCRHFCEVLGGNCRRWGRDRLPPRDVKSLESRSPRRAQTLRFQ